MSPLLGTTMKDQITGFKGVVVGYCQYITGCHQVLLVPKVGKDGSYVDSCWFDEQRCTQVGTKVVDLDNTKTPGFDKAAPKR